MRKSSSSRPDRQPVLSNRPTDRTLKCLQKTIQIIITFNVFTNPNLETNEKRKNIQRLGSAFLSGVANLRTTWKRKERMLNRKYLWKTITQPWESNPGPSPIRKSWSYGNSTSVCWVKRHISLPLSSEHTLVSSRETSSEEDELDMGAFGVIALTTLSLRCICRRGMIRENLIIWNRI